MFTKHILSLSGIQHSGVMNDPVNLLHLLLCVCRGTKIYIAVNFFSGITRVTGFNGLRSFITVFATVMSFSVVKRDGLQSSVLEVAELLKLFAAPDIVPTQFSGNCKKKKKKKKSPACMYPVSVIFFPIFFFFSLITCQSTTIWGKKWMQNGLSNCSIKSTAMDNCFSAVPLTIPPCPSRSAGLSVGCTGAGGSGHLLVLLLWWVVCCGGGICRGLACVALVHPALGLLALPE